MNNYASCFYFGTVIHERRVPKFHRFKYPMFQMLFDLDELSSLSGGLRLFSHNKFNLIAFHDSDHGDGGPGTLRDCIDRLAAQAGLNLGGGKVAVLCMPRVLGYVFNPISIIYCYDYEGRICMTVYEVNNTFGQRHFYVITGGGNRYTVRQMVGKKFYVSPFMDMDMRYEFSLIAPGSTVITTIRATALPDVLMMFATFSGRRKALSDRACVVALLGYPLLTLGVVVAIHWEALKLFAKGLKLRHRPFAPANAVTIASVDEPAHSAD